MTIHLTARLAWHDHGWDGHICRDPANNSYCVGHYSYPGQIIAEKRELVQEKPAAGLPIDKLKFIPPCITSANAFGKESLTAFSDPPDFFGTQAKRTQWAMPAATASVWPYELMYEEDVRQPIGGFDNDRRRAKAKAFFERIEPNRSLIFYYANYSNPFSDDESYRYALIGVSRVKTIGPERFYRDCSDDIKRRYADGIIWQRDISSHFPDQGFRIPYHRYSGDAETLNSLVLFPDNARVCKYGSRHLTDDDALGLVEQFLSVASRLMEIGDASENWSGHVAWLRNLVAELWRGRGLYPGLPAVLSLLRFEPGIEYLRRAAATGKEREAHDELFSSIEGRTKTPVGLNISTSQLSALNRQWQLREEAERTLLKSVFPRLALRREQMNEILSPLRTMHGIAAKLQDIPANPYLLCEQYVGDDPDDIIPWGTIDRGVFPTADLGGAPLSEMQIDGWERLRALCVDRLRRERVHTFLPAGEVIRDVNRKLELLPESRRQEFTERYLEVDADALDPALEQRIEEGGRYLYWRPVYDDERSVEATFASLLNRPELKLKRPVAHETWIELLRDRSSPLRASKEYDHAIKGQAEACQRSLLYPLLIVTGAAGTGKSTLARAIIKALRRVEGVDSRIAILAPTGKAAERIREILSEDDDKSLSASINPVTVHSFISAAGWLNDNLTFKRTGGQRNSAYETVVIDESSMLELAMTATLFRAIDWHAIKRLILVGDPNQLPPIGRGRVFADVIDHVAVERPDAIISLTVNLRQLENRLQKRGTGILQLASLFVRTSLAENKDEKPDLDTELFLRRVQAGGDVDRDLRVTYWNDGERLPELIFDQVETDIGPSGKNAGREEATYEVWKRGFNNDPGAIQIISPHRGEPYGIEALNAAAQWHVQGNMLERVGQIDGITLFDKVIQFRNRPKSDRIAAFSTKTRKTERIEIFNGQMGFVKPHGFDKNWTWSGFYLKRFQVVFDRREDYWVGYGAELGKDEDGKWLRREAIEENLELAYAISVHKAQGSEFDHTYVVVPRKLGGLSTELIYTAITRAKQHCTLFVEGDVGPLIDTRRRENARLAQIASSLFVFRQPPEALRRRGSWYEAGKIHTTITDFMVRSKSEVIIANMLHEAELEFRYEMPLTAPEGTMYLPDFTIKAHGQTWFWEHVGRLDLPDYRAHWEEKKRWYAANFAGQLIVTLESGNLSRDAQAIVSALKSGRVHEFLATVD